MEKKILCFVFLCYVVIPVFCNIKFTVNESFSIQQIEPKEKSIEVSTQQILYSIEGDSIIKHELIGEYDFVSTFQVENVNNTFILNYVKDNTVKKLYAITFKPQNKVLINNTDIYLLKKESYLKLYHDLQSNKNIVSIFQFLSSCHYVFIDVNLQNLPFHFYTYEYEILEGFFLIQSPDSNLELIHTLKYKSDKNGTVSISSNCADENFIGLNYEISFKQSKISNVTIEIKYFERRSGKYNVNFDYKKNTITVHGESIHSYFTDVINYSFVTDVLVSECVN